MDYKTLTEKLEKYAPAIGLNKAFPSGPRRFLKTATLILTFVFLFVYLAGTFNQTISQTIPAQIFEGLAEIMGALWLLFFCLDAFYSSLYFDDLKLVARESFFKNPATSGSFLTAVALSGNDADLTARFLKSPVGKTLTMRLEIPANERPAADVERPRADVADTWRDSPPDFSTFSISPDCENIFEEFVTTLYKQDKSFADFLFRYGITEKKLRGTADWLTQKSEKEKRARRFWSRDNLGRVPGIGKDWSYGQTYALEKYGGLMADVFDFTSRGLGLHTKYVNEIENVLSRKSEGNIILVADDDLEKTDIVIEFCKKIASGKILPMLEHKVIFTLDISAMTVAGAQKDNFEKEFLAVLNQAERAGNIILFIDDLPNAISASASIGSDVLSLLNPYLSSSVLQIIAGSDVKSFHEKIESSVSLMEKFEKIILKDDDEESLIGLLEERADDLEIQTGIFFSYPAILEIAENASRYFTGGVISDKALDMLSELPISVARNGQNMVTKKDVSAITEAKTGVPTGEIETAEKDKLLNLEKILHERIIGQDEAVSAISSALRRARSGIESKTRPLGSFLFLGPTGVGKTETTKALAEVFFGDEKKIMRLDMSEYSGSDALSRLIGSFEGGKQGVLTSLLRENQYGVLLLDEFEKASRETHDLFLQILDEGIFSDMLGKKVNARNLIIIATSNAGSDIIWDYVKQQKDLAKNKQTIIDAIIKEGVFRPELLNRFDGVILFHPLDEKLLKQVATLMLKRLAKRLEEKSLELVITDELVNYLVKVGSDPAFGARPINRAIQDQVEETIARKLISGDIKPGSEVVLTEADLQK
jgi:ATP-dependent Clp protease ATP-binding subunit ClpA